MPKRINQVGLSIASSRIGFSAAWPARLADRRLFSPVRQRCSRRLVRSLERLFSPVAVPESTIWGNVRDGWGIRGHSRAEATEESESPVEGGPAPRHGRDLAQEAGSEAEHRPVDVTGPSLTLTGGDSGSGFTAALAGFHADSGTRPPVRLGSIALGHQTYRRSWSA